MLCTRVALKAWATAIFSSRLSGGVWVCRSSSGDDSSDRKGPLGSGSALPAGSTGSERSQAKQPGIAGAEAGPPLHMRQPRAMCQAMAGIALAGSGQSRMQMQLMRAADMGNSGSGRHQDLVSCWRGGSPTAALRVGRSLQRLRANLPIMLSRALMGCLPRCTENITWALAHSLYF